jgi:hypothetical protein
MMIMGSISQRLPPHDREDDGVSPIFTASYREYRPEMGVAVVTSRGLPKWRLAEAEGWPHCWLLAPGHDYYDAPADEFERAYLAQLDRHGPAKIGRVLADIAREHHAESVVLLCHEIRWEDCHRILAARWITERTGELVEELLT